MGTTRTGRASDGEPQRIAFALDRVAASGVRRRLRPLDEVISLLEERNLAGERIVDRGLRQRLREIEAHLGLPLPRKVVRARNTARLHAGLLDWRETLLDELLPGRLNFPDVHDADSVINVLSSDTMSFTWLDGEPPLAAD